MAASNANGASAVRDLAVALPPDRRGPALRAVLAQYEVDLRERWWRILASFIVVTPIGSGFAIASWRIFAGAARRRDLAELLRRRRAVRVGNAGWCKCTSAVVVCPVSIGFFGLAWCICTKVSAYRAVLDAHHAGDGALRGIGLQLLDALGDALALLGDMTATATCASS